MLSSALKEEDMTADGAQDFLKQLMGAGASQSGIKILKNSQ